jgi:demethylmenaquinone methyltransferase/2-methoxy-6-polyprenyl-1,4-benzoquinol methylase
MLPSAPWRERREALRELFETIAPSYDRLNRVLSFGIDESWRKRTAQEAIAVDERGRVLDLASGTGDLAAALERRAPDARVVRLDLSGPLLRRGEEKLRAAARHPGVVAEMERPPLKGGSCTAITMGFALRHVESLDALLTACYRVLQPGGRLAFVDMALPERGPWASLYRFYFRRCLPRIAVLFGGDREAYAAMVRSVESFPGWDALERAAGAAGFARARRLPLTGGAACLFVADKSSAGAGEPPASA